MSTSAGISGIKANKHHHIHINDLPDCIISYILSRLPMLDAVRTSILAKDWKYKWTSIYKLDLDDTKPCRYSKATFVNFVERTLCLSHDFKSFRLSCAKTYDSNDILRWISTALARDLHGFEICYREAGIVLPPSPSLVSCNSLRKLVLKTPCTFKVPANICFPHLTTLHLERVKILNDRPDSDTVKFDFPVLETFELIGCKWLNVKCVEIIAPKRTTFKYEAPGGENPHSIKISADGLVKFESCAYVPGNIVLYGGLEVVDATLGSIPKLDDDPLVLEKTGLQIRALLKGFLSLTDLVLYGTAAKVIALSKPTGLSFPIYYKMERLNVHSSGNAEVLLELLHTMPFLKILAIDVINCNDYDYDAEQYVPLCIVSHLEEVNFRFFAGKMGQFKLAKFFLQNALQLKSACLSSCNYNQISWNQIKKELATYPKASSCLNISITKFYR